MLCLAHDEVAFYDASEVNGSAVKILGDAALQAVARDSVRAVQRERIGRLSDQGIGAGEPAPHREAGFAEARLPVGQNGASGGHGTTASGNSSERVGVVPY